MALFFTGIEYIEMLVVSEESTSPVTLDVLYPIVRWVAQLAERLKLLSRPLLHREPMVQDYR